jgi:TPR repeat protein
MLGVLYDQEPNVVKRNLRRSTEYYRKAAELGFSGSQNNLAWAYYKGRGVKKNVPEAIYWATRSAEQGEPFAYSTLSEIRYEGNGFPRDDVETLKWTMLALNSLPQGVAEQNIRKQSEALMHRMTREAIEKSKTLVKNWRPLVEGGLTMRDKDDK